MCTAMETKRVVYEAFEEVGGIGEQIRKDIKSDFQSSLLKIMGTFVVIFLGSLISFTVYLNNIKNDVEDLQNFARSGERFTQDDAAILRFQIESNREALENLANKEQFNELKDAFIKLDERLRNKGI